MKATESRDERLRGIAVIAADLETKTGLPAQLTIAQWAVESAWGTAPAGHANYFGIKFSSARHTASCLLDTHEVIDGKVEEIQAKFADYPSLVASAADYASLITQTLAYAPAWTNYQQTRNLDALIAGVAGVYSTSPWYAQLVTDVAHQADIVAAIETVRNTARAMA